MINIECLHKSFSYLLWYVPFMFIVPFLGLVECPVAEPLSNTELVFHASSWPHTPFLLPWQNRGGGIMGTTHIYLSHNQQAAHRQLFDATHGQGADLASESCFCFYSNRVRFSLNPTQATTPDVSHQLPQWCNKAPGLQETQYSTCKNDQISPTLHFRSQWFMNGSHNKSLTSLGWGCSELRSHCVFMFLHQIPPNPTLTEHKDPLSTLHASTWGRCS